MKRLLTLGLFLTLLCLAHAQPPRMTVRDQDGSVKLLRLEQAAVSVSFSGDVAETVLELNFRNDGERAVEGEFVLPLPDGATVSGYALEVNGKLRDGVVVEKERARTAYETVKRRMIDPGIVEREAGNIYRTKVYPVPARGTKRLRIRYNETLRPSARGLDYSLPLAFPDPLAAFSCAITGTGPGEILVTGNAGLDLVPDPTGGLRAELRDAKPNGTLALSLKAPAGPRMMLENEPQSAFLLSDRVPDIAPRPRPPPATVLLVWDASASGSTRDHKKEFALLESWFAKLGRTRVKLRLLRDRLEDAGEFEIRNGRWPKLKQALQQVDYDGATFISRLKVSTGEADLVVFVSDGISTLGAGGPEIGVPWVFVRSGPPGPTRLSAEAIIDLTTGTPSASLAKLTHQPLRLIAVVGGDLENLMPVHDVMPGAPLRISGTLKGQRAGKLELRYGFGSDVVSTREVSYQPGGSPGGIVRRIHSQQVLAGLEQEARPDRKRIVDHCKRHGLVSDHTSFIVLERLQDYAEFQIPPPEAELQQAYQQLVGKRAAQGTPDFDRLADRWTEKLRWFERRFPGYEALILPRVRQVGIWKKSLESRFAPAQRDAEAFATIAGWFDKAVGLIAEKPKLRSQAEYDTWRMAIDGLHAQGPVLAKTPLHPPPAGQPLAVSVSGLVAKPGVITRDSAMTLRQAIEHAGGLNPLGSLDNVALYRNAGKIVYNTLSEQFQDVPLYPGDMLVVGQKDYPHRYADPFSGPSPSASSDPRTEVAVRDQTDLWLAPATDSSPDSFQGIPAAGKVRSDEAASPDLTPFGKALEGGRDPVSAYRQLKGGKIYQPRFYVEAARHLFANHHPDLARRVLSNLVESRPGEIAAVRAHAFWLAEFAQVEEAGAVLNPLFGDDSAALPLCLDLASIHAIKGDPAAAAKTLFPALANIQLRESGPLAAIALTEYNAFQRAGKPSGGKHPLAKSGNSYQKNLTADIRIVATSTGGGGSLRFEVREPGGFTCSSAASPSPSGGRVSASGGVREYMIRRAVPGTYQIFCASDHPATVRVVIHTRWGRPDQKSKVVTLLLNSDGTLQAGEIDIDFQAGGN